MSPEAIPAGGVAEASEPRGTPYNGGTLAIRYRVTEPAEAARAFTVRTPVSPPEDLLLDVEVAVENHVVFLRAVQVDVAIEEDVMPLRAFSSLVSAVKGWLTYLEEEEPELAPDLEPQRRYTALLGYDPQTWFRRAFLAS